VTANPEPQKSVDDGLEWERLVGQHNGYQYRAPVDLEATPLPVQRVLVIGSCMACHWVPFLKEKGVKTDYVLTNNFSPLPDQPPVPADQYDFQLIQIPLRSVLHENTYSGLPYHDVGVYEDLLQRTKGHVCRYLDALLRWNAEHGLLTFVTNFLVPQQSPLGRLVPRHDLRNMVHFVERLNGVLYEEIAKRKNVHLVDIDQISATIGKRHLQDDAVWVLSHGATLNDAEHQSDQARIQPVPRMSEHYPLIADGRPMFFEMAWAETVAMYRTVRQVDQVKLVIVDLDDTLWRGVAADAPHIDQDMIEGWPIGVMEALRFLKKRGVLLAITSKNDETRITELWDRLTGGRLHIADFAVRKINWRSKTENIRDILREVNVTARSVVFVDDNPVERAAVEAAFPKIRVIGAHPYYNRRILLWAPETQVAVITDESGRRTEMVQAQIEREENRQSMSRDDFLQSLGLRMRILEIRSTDDRQFPRSLELINKTNQFNTTGRRWTAQECEQLFRGGGTFYAFELQDKFSHYGLVGIAIVDNFNISQFVMSCRVVGLDAEFALLAQIGRQSAQRGATEIIADLRETELNALCRDLYQKAGFSAAGSGWMVDPAVLVAPPYIDVEAQSPNVETQSSGRLSELTGMPLGV
jgi:FkbH-like protein